MTATRLDMIRVEKPWGRNILWPGFDVPSENTDAIGEIWFTENSSVVPPLLVKYLFTAERLSVQVHPNDEQARKAGYPHGKDEAWIILAADPGATIALGPLVQVTKADLRAAALDGSIEHLLNWTPVKAGDVIYSPAGTIHAIGAGLTLIEIQQNLDLTYRLFDYARARLLNLDAGLDVATLTPFVVNAQAKRINEGRTIVCDGNKFIVERWSWYGSRHIEIAEQQDGLFVPITGTGTIDGQAWHASQCWRVADNTVITLQHGSDALFAYAGAKAPLTMSNGNQAKL